MGSAQQLVAAERDHIYILGQHLLHGGFTLLAIPVQLDQATAPQVVNNRHPVFFPERNQFLQPRFFGKSHHAEIAGMDLQDYAGFSADCSFIIRPPGAVGCPHLAQPGAAFFHDLRDTELTADFN